MLASSFLNQASTASTELHKNLEAHEDYNCGFEALQHKKYINNPMKLTFLQKIKDSDGRSFFNGAQQALYSDIANELKLTGCNTTVTGPIIMMLRSKLLSISSPWTLS
jgi:hypothetical protein